MIISCKKRKPWWVKKTGASETYLKDHGCVPFSWDVRKTGWKINGKVIFQKFHLVCWNKPIENYLNILFSRFQPSLKKSGGKCTGQIMLTDKMANGKYQLHPVADTMQKILIFLPLWFQSAQLDFWMNDKYPRFALLASLWFFFLTQTALHKYQIMDWTN